jgi:hypothetical protein
VPERVLSPRLLNRALLARQGLLERSSVPVPELVEWLVGMQAQVPENPYVALHARLSTFDPHTLSAAIEAGEAVRAQLMRATIHLVTRRDLAAIAPITADVLARTFKSQFSRRLPRRHRRGGRVRRPTSASATPTAPGSSAAAGRACRSRAEAGSGRCSSTASTAHRAPRAGHA